MIENINKILGTVFVSWAYNAKERAKKSLIISIEMPSNSYGKSLYRNLASFSCAISEFWIAVAEEFYGA